MKKAHRYLAGILALTLLFSSGSLSALAEFILTLPVGLEVIEEEAFYGSTSLDKVVLSERTTEIRAKAFADSSLSEINLPDSLEYIADDAFDGTGNVTFITTPGSYAEKWVSLHNTDGTDRFITQNGIEYQLLEGGNLSVFNVDESLTDIVIPATVNGHNVTEIGGEAFVNRTMNSLSLPEGLKKINQNAFFEVELSQLTIPPTVTEISSYAFGLSVFTEISLPDSMKRINEYTFAACSFERIDLPDELEYIGEGAFKDNERLTSITIPESVTTIESEAFFECSRLASVSIPENLLSESELLDRFFATPWLAERKGCISTGDYLSVGENKVMLGDYSYMSVYVTAEKDSVITLHFDDRMGFRINLGLYTVPYETELDYCDIGMAEDFSYTFNIAKDEILNIEFGTLGCEPDIYTVTVEQTAWDVQSLDGMTFEENSDGTLTLIRANRNLQNVVIPDTVDGKTVTGIDGRVFADRTDLLSITIPDTVLNLEEDSFYGCTSLSQVDIPQRLIENAQDILCFAKTRWLCEKYGCLCEESVLHAGTNDILMTAHSQLFRIEPENDCYLTLSFDNLTGIDIYLNDGEDVIFSDSESFSALLRGGHEYTMEIGRPSYEAYYGKVGLNLQLTPVLIENGIVFSYLDDGTLSVKSVLSDSATIVIPSEVNGIAVTEIQATAFIYGYIQKITIPESITAIDPLAFKECQELTEVIASDELLSRIDVIKCFEYTPWCADFFGWLRDGDALSPGNNTIWLDGYTWFAAVEVPDDMAGEIIITAENLPEESSFHLCDAVMDWIYDSDMNPFRSSFSETGKNTQSLRFFKVAGEKNYIEFSDIAYGTHRIDITVTVNDQPTVYLLDTPALTSHQFNIDPKNPTTVPDEDLSLTWEHVSGADSYSIQVEYKSTDDWISKLSTSTVETQYVLSGNLFDITDDDVQYRIGLGSLPDETDMLHSASDVVWYYITILENETDVPSSDFVFIVDDGGVLTGYLGEIGSDISIPETVNGIKVTSIGEEAFYGCSNLTGIEIPDSVTDIGNEAFSNCVNLSNVTLHEGLTRIGEEAFYNTGLSAVVLPDSIQILGSSAFNTVSYVNYPTGWNEVAGWYSPFAGSSITEITIPEGVNAIPDRAFFGNFSDDTLMTVNLPGTLEKIGNRAFANQSGIQTITLPETLSNIGSYAFAHCQSLSGLEFPDSVSVMGSSIVSDCCNLTSINYPKGLSTVIDDGGGYGSPFESLNADTIFTWPDGITSICSYAFMNCEFTSIELPDGLETIGDYAFSYCEKLVSVDIPDSVTSIGDFAFCDCEKIRYINLPENLKEIGKCAFNSCISLENVEFNESLETIDMGAFSFCKSLEYVEIPDNVTHIGEGAFGAYETNLTIKLPLSWNGWVAGIVNGNYSCLRKVIIPNGVRTIDDDMFSYLSGLETVEIPESVTSIGIGSFRGCTSLESLKLPSKVKEIGEYAFYNCTDLSSITLPERLESIGNYAFSNCTGLSNLDFPDALKEIGRYAFYNCNNLRRLNFSEGLESIDDSAFSACKGITRIELPEGLNIIGEYAFSDCNNLMDICIPAGIITVGGCVFSGCDNLCDIYFGGTKEEWDALCVLKNDAIVHYGDFTEVEENDEIIPVRGIVATESGDGLANVSVVVMDENNDILGIADTDINGKWSIIDRVNKQYGKIYYTADGYSISGNGNRTYFQGQRISATARLETAESEDIVFSMKQDGKAVSTIVAGTSVQVKVSAPGAERIRLVVDGITYEDYPVDGKGTTIFDRRFTQAGTRSVQIQTCSGGVWDVISSSQILNVTSEGALDVPSIDTIGTHSIGDSLTVSWDGVDNADGYRVYLYYKQTELYNKDVQYGHICTIPSGYFTRIGDYGDYSVDVIAYGVGYEQATGSMLFAVSTTDQVSVSLNTPHNKDTFTVGDLIYPSATQFGNGYMNIRVTDPDGEYTYYPGGRKWSTPNSEYWFTMTAEKAGEYRFDAFVYLNSGEQSADEYIASSETVVVKVEGPAVRSAYVEKETFTWTDPAHANHVTVRTNRAADKVVIYENGIALSDECTPDVVADTYCDFYIDLNKNASLGRHDYQIFVSDSVHGLNGDPYTLTFYNVGEVNNGMKVYPQKESILLYSSPYRGTVTAKAYGGAYFDTLTVIGETDGWYRVTTEESINGFVKVTDVANTAPVDRSGTILLEMYNNGDEATFKWRYGFTIPNSSTVNQYLWINGLNGNTYSQLFPCNTKKITCSLTDGYYQAYIRLTVDEETYTSNTVTFTIGDFSLDDSYRSWWMGTVWPEYSEYVNMTDMNVPQGEFPSDRSIAFAPVYDLAAIKVREDFSDANDDKTTNAPTNYALLDDNELRQYARLAIAQSVTENTSDQVADLKDEYEALARLNAQNASIQKRDALVNTVLQAGKTLYQGIIVFLKTWLAINPVPETEAVVDIVDKVASYIWDAITEIVGDIMEAYDAMFEIQAFADCYVELLRRECDVYVDYLNTTYFGNNRAYGFDDDNIYREVASEVIADFEEIRNNEDKLINIAYSRILEGTGYGIEDITPDTLSLERLIKDICSPENIFNLLKKELENLLKDTIKSMNLSDEANEKIFVTLSTSLVKNASFDLDEPNGGIKIDIYKIVGDLYAEVIKYGAFDFGVRAIALKAQNYWKLDKSIDIQASLSYFVNDGEVSSKFIAGLAQQEKKLTAMAEIAGKVADIASDAWDLGKEIVKLIRSGVYLAESLGGKADYDAYGVNLITQCKTKFATKLAGGVFKMEKANLDNMSVEELESLRQAFVSCLNLDDDILFTYGEMKSIGENKYNKYYYTRTMGMGYETTYLWGIIFNPFEKKKLIIEYAENDNQYVWLTNGQLEQYKTKIRTMRNTVEQLPAEYQSLFSH